MCILCLVRSSESVKFLELARFDGLSHVLMLSGDYVTCALQNDIALLHLVNWRTKESYALETSPHRKVIYVPNFASYSTYSV
jgi:hypothetical protein